VLAWLVRSLFLLPVPHEQVPTSLSRQRLYLPAAVVYAVPSRPRFRSMTHLKSRDSGGRMRTGDFAIYASYQIKAGGLFVGMLKVIIKINGRMLLPFQSAPVA
jgi:hypothetical protein